MAATEPYSGPSVREMLESHTFAKEVITRANGPESQRIFDDERLTLLRRWCVEPEAAGKLLAEEDLVDAPGDKPGTKAIEKGSLIGMLMANSIAGTDLITKEEFKMLQDWFKQN